MHPVGSFKNFTYGRSISEERKTLANLNENMLFKGSQRDRHYRKMVLGDKKPGIPTKSGRLLNEIRAKIKDDKKKQPNAKNRTLTKIKGNPRRGTTAFRS